MYFLGAAVKNSKDSNAADEMLTVLPRPRSKVVVVLASGPNAGRTFGIDSDNFSIGTDPDCDVRLNETLTGRTRRLHCQMSDDGWRIEPSGADSFFVGTNNTSKSTKLRSGEIVRLSHRGPDFQFYLQIGDHPLEQLVESYLPSARLSDSPQEEASPSDHGTGDARQTQIMSSSAVDASHPPTSAGETPENDSLRATQVIGDGRPRETSDATAHVEATELWDSNRRDSHSWLGHITSHHGILLIAIAALCAMIAIILIVLLFFVALRWL